MGESEIYLDYAAATPCDPRVFACMEPYFTRDFYNPSSSYQAARRVRDVYESARHRLAMAIGAKQSEIILTSGATESINLAIHGVVSYYGGRVATSRIEHMAIVRAAERHDVDWIECDERGCVTAEAVARVITPETALVSVGAINNELGTVQPLRDIVAVIETERQRRLQTGSTTPIWLHVDASQAVGMIDISVSRLGVDLMTLNSGKCYGPKGVGLLWARSGVELTPLIDGGGQENGRRGGTENVAGAVGFAEAVTIAVNERKTESHRLGQLRDRLQRTLEPAIDDLVVNGHTKRRAPHILHISVPGLDGERALFALDDRGVQVATGSACAANHGTRSHVLTAVGMEDELADGSLRMSIGRGTTEQDIDDAAKIIIDVIARERAR